MKSALKVVMEFDLTSHEGRRLESMARQGMGYEAALCELSDWLRQQYKYNNKPWAQEVRIRLAMRIRQGEPFNGDFIRNVELASFLGATESQVAVFGKPLGGGDVGCRS